MCVCKTEKATGQEDINLEIRQVCVEIENIARKLGLHINQQKIKYINRLESSQIQAREIHVGNCAKN